MAENRTPTPAQHSPAAYGYCSWHQGYSRGVRLIRVIEQGSGPGVGGNVFACRSCREAYGLVPFADQP